MTSWKAAPGARGAVHEQPPTSTRAIQRPQPVKPTHKAGPRPQFSFHHPPFSHPPRRYLPSRNATTMGSGIRYAVVLVFVFCLNGLSRGMECSFGDTNLVSKVLNHCPGLFDSSDKSYCCYDWETEKAYCCDSMEFTMKSTWFLLTGIVAVVLVVSLVVFCVSCLCCSCCPWHKRRHRGTVYGRVQVPQVVHVIQTQPHPANSAEIGQPPLNSVYGKQAPYNPNYAP